MRTIRRWTTETAGGLPATFWYLWTGTLINRVGSFVIVLLAIYLTQVRDFSPTFAGLVIGLWGAGGALGTLLGGVLADRWGRKPTYLTALYASAALMLALGFAQAPLLVAGTVIALGLASEAARPAMSALMIDVVSERDRMRAFSLNYWVINLGFAFSSIAAGALAGVDYFLLFVLDAITTVIAATVVAIKVREAPRVRVVSTPSPGTGAESAGVAGAAGLVGRRPGLRQVFADRVFLGFFACNLLLALVFLQHISSLPLAMAADGLSTATYGMVIALNGILIVVGQLFVPRLLRGRSRASTLAVAAVLTGAGFALTAFAGAPLFYAVTVVIWTLGEMLNAPSNSATMAELSPAHMRGRYQGVFSLSWSIAAFGAPIIGGAVLQHIGDTTLWLGCFVVCLIVAAGHLLGGPARERRAADLRTADADLRTADAALPTADAALPTAPAAAPGLTALATSSA